MAAHLDAEQLQQAFGSRPDILAGIQSAADSPARIALFNSISQFVCEQGNAGDEPASKRRRVDGANGGTNDASHGVNRATLPARQAVPGSAVASSGANGDVMSAAAAELVLLEIKDISLSVPQRKKFDLCFTRNYLYARVPGTTAPVSGIVYEWKTIEHVFYVPVPDKAQIQHNYVLFPHHAALASLPSAAAAAALPSAPAEPLLFTVPATAPKPGSVGGPSAGLAASVSDTYSSLLHWALEAQLRSAGNRLVPAGLGNAVVAADARVFHSTTRPAFRPAEKAVHVRAFRGSKDGFLFFLPTGILWGFKKPLLFLTLDRIVAVSYTNVLQRTFNMVVEVDVGGGGQTEEIEFAMIDQEDYGVIDENYVRRHGLQDRSMAEQRKAKRELAENARGEGKKKGGDGDGEGAEEGDDGDDKEMTGTGDDEDDGLTELQRAEKQLQDEEDEMEEDYDPGSDSDSEGSGSSEDEEDSEEGEGGEEDGDDDDGGEPEDREEEEEEEAEHFDVVGKDE